MQIGYKFKILIFVGALIVLVVGAYLFFMRQVYYSTGSLKSGAVEFEIQSGEKFIGVGKKLKGAGLISNDVYFDFYMWRTGMHHEIKAGEYSIKAGLNIPEISLLITKGKVADKEEERKVTFPEGWDTKKIKARLDSNELDTKNFSDLVASPKYFRDKYGYEFLEGLPSDATLEGFLFPDTYFFSVKESSEEIIKTMLDNFDEKMTPDLVIEIQKQKKTVFEIVTMASIIEREVTSDADKKIVGGIFWSRIEVGQALQSCATLAYILGENKEQYSYEDTRIESPYNTYLYPGLPSGPIANPGFSSIVAAIYPTETDYNYFLTSLKTGETIFSKTLDEHNTNKELHGL